eukprot:SAG31_NODE_36494_length_312_cov_15.957746_1_plen_71_part_01
MCCSLLVPSEQLRGLRVGVGPSSCHVRTVDPGQWPVRYRALSPTSAPHTVPSWLAKAFRLGLPRYITWRGY